VPQIHPHPLIDKIRRDLETVGLVGEEDNGVLTHLVGTSRLLDNPGAIVTRGETGAGKSTVLTKVALLFPKEAKVEAMSLTPASLFNFPPDYFVHKFLVTGERKHATDDATRDSNAILRQLISEKRISRTVSVYNQAEMKWESHEVVREGPIAYAESTSAGSIFAEDLNRMLQVYVDPTEQQTRRVMVATARRYEPGRKMEDVEDVIAWHHEFQRSLVHRDVRIPYWQALAENVPASRIEARRVMQQVLTVIESIVLLHQHHRVDQDGELIATWSDYSLARRLLLPPVHAAMGLGQDFKEAAVLKSKLSKPLFTSKDVKVAMGLKNNMGPSRLLTKLVLARILLIVEEAAGRKAATYRWADDIEWMVLPTVETLKDWSRVTA
jgi:hypothetical protein